MGVVPRWNDKKFKNEESVEERKGKYQAEGNMIDEREGNEVVGISMG